MMEPQTKPRSVPKWTGRSFEARCMYILHSNHLTDCVFEVGLENEKTEIIKSYKWILSEASPVFERMFNGDFKESNSNEPIRVSDATAKNFKRALHFIYYEKELWDISTESIQGIILLAEKYMIPCLKNRYMALLMKRIQDAKFPEVIDCLLFAKLNSMGDLKHRCELRLARFKTEDITNIFYTSILELPPMTFIQAFRWLTEIGPAKRFYMAEFYLKYHDFSRDVIDNQLLCLYSTDDQPSSKTTPPKNMREKMLERNMQAEEHTISEEFMQLKDLNVEEYTSLIMSEINFSKMTVAEFMEGPDKSDILSEQDKKEKLQMAIDTPSDRKLTTVEMICASDEGRRYRPGLIH